MKYCEKVYSTIFSGDDSKRTYLNACKWLATDFISKQQEIGDCQFEIVKLPEKPKGTYHFQINVYVSLDEAPIGEKTCDVCKEVHGMFYMNRENCNSCNASAYRSRLAATIKIKADYIRERINRAGVWHGEE